MSRNEVIQAYQNGRIGRREFIRRMTVTGASLVAAVAMADELRAAPAVPTTRTSALVQSDDVYGDDVYGGGDNGESVTDLPDTGAGLPMPTDSGLLKPISLAASAAAAAVAFRLRRMRNPETETE